MHDLSLIYEYFQSQKMQSQFPFNFKIVLRFKIKCTSGLFSYMRVSNGQSNASIYFIEVRRV